METSLTKDAILWLSNHVTGPNGECGPFRCYWCGKTVASHVPGCPAYEAIHALDTNA